MPLPTLFVHDRGQMCNNILQFGHIHAWATEHGVRAVSVRFAYKYRYFAICHTPWHNFATYAAAKLARALRLLPTVDFDIETPATEADMSALLGRHRCAWVDGWQVHFHDLFAKHRADICRLFAFVPEVEQAAQLRMMPWLTRKDCVCLGVHVRRGDYARFLGGRYFYDDATMQRLIREFAALHTGRSVVAFVCGNDPALERDAYRRAVPGVTFVFPGGSPGEDLCLLSHCHWLIGPPSTFSLVAAMYRDVPLCWVRSADMPVTAEAFSTFDRLFRQISETFGAPRKW
ncbi:MAG: alpha-1,2-fucosyltransferase [Bacteroidaceae bacterium]|nr:alpha-1,2-fucosyltransferase [Bacteroidaceae bacterium]